MTHGYSYAKAMFCFNRKSKSHNSVHKHFLDIEVSFPRTCSINQPWQKSYFVIDLIHASSKRHWNKSEDIVGVENKRNTR